MIIFMQDARKSLMTVFVLAYHTLQTEQTAKDASPTDVHAPDFGNNLERKLKKTWRTKTKLAPGGKYGKITFREHGQFPLKLRTIIAEFTNFGQSGRFERDTCEFSLAKINLSTNLTKHPISFSRLFAFQNNLSANF